MLNQGDDAIKQVPACQQWFPLHNALVRKLLIVVLLGWGCLAARPNIVPIPEDQQAALALNIINSYHNPRPASPPKQLHILYYTPSDREPAPEYEQRLGAIMEDIHDFYGDGMKRLGFGIAFSSENKVKTLRVGRTTAKAVVGALVEGWVAVHGGGRVAGCVG